MNYLYHPDTIPTASELETLAEGLLAEIPVPGVESYGFNSKIICRTLPQAAVDQKYIKAVAETTRETYSDDYTLAQFHTVPPEELETIVNYLFAQEGAMILGPSPRIVCLDVVDIHYHDYLHAAAGDLCHTKPHDSTSQCHRYIAGFVLCRAKPPVVTVTPVGGDESKSDAVKLLLNHVAALPFEVSELLTDRVLIAREQSSD